MLKPKKSLNHISRIIVKDILSIVKKTFNEYKLNPIEFSGFEINLKDYELYGYDSFENKLNVYVLLLRDEEEDFTLKVDANAGLDFPHIGIAIQINPKVEPNIYSEVYMRLIDTTRHELQHIHQYQFTPWLFTDDEMRNEINSNPDKTFKYFILPEEIPAMVRGLYLRAKKEKRPIIETIQNYLNYFLDLKLINHKEFNFIISEWKKYAIKHLPSTKDGFI